MLTLLFFSGIHFFSTAGYSNCESTGTDHSPKEVPYVTTIEVNPASTDVIGIGRFDGRVLLWNHKTKQPIREFYTPSGGVDCLAFTPDGKKLAVAGDEDSRSSEKDGVMSTSTIKNPTGLKVRIWDTETGKQIGQIKNTDADITCIRFSPDGALLAGVTRGQVGLWNARDCEIVGFAKTNHLSLRNSLAFTPDGQFLTVATFAGDILILEIPTLELRGTLSGHGKGITSLIFLDKTTLVSAGWDKSIKIWNIKTKKCNSTIMTNVRISCLSLTKDRKILAAGSKQDPVELFDDGAKRITQLPVGSIKLIETQNWTEKNSLNGIKLGVQNMQFVDGHILYYHAYWSRDLGVWSTNQ